MKIDSGHLDTVRGLLVKSTERLNAHKKVAREAEELRASLEGEVRGLQGGFDVCAQAFASDAELVQSQLDSLPASAQVALGYKRSADPAAEPEA